jgi:mono/diheme cytochrome c family protein
MSATGESTTPGDPVTPGPLRREGPDPREARNPLPALFLVLFGGLVFFGGQYLVRYGGTDFSFAGDQRSPGAGASGASAEMTGEQVFTASCAPCHQASGRGVPNAFPPLAGSPWLLEDPETPIRIVLMGLQGPIEVEGARFNGAMPTLGGTMDDRKIAGAITYARGAWGNAAPPITVEQVAKVRAGLAGRSEPWAGGDALAAARKKP